MNNYKASKQADALMLFYLLSAEELLGLFGRLGYHFTPEQIPKTVDYYLSRTSDGWTLSAIVHSWVLARASRHNPMKYFCRYWVPISSTSRAAPHRKEYTWPQWPVASICCKGVSPDWKHATTGWYSAHIGRKRSAPSSSHSYTAAAVFTFGSADELGL